MKVTERLRNSLRLVAGRKGYWKGFKITPKLLALATEVGGSIGEGKFRK